LVLDLPGEEAVVAGISLSSKALARHAGREILAGIRPEHFALDPEGRGLPVRIEVIEPTGPDMLAIFRAGGTEVTARLDPYSVKAGETASLSVKADKIVLFDPETERRID
jgi:multiple sugar transport system ATP-binding protein